MGRWKVNFARDLKKFEERGIGLVAESQAFRNVARSSVSGSFARDKVQSIIDSLSSQT